MEYNKARSIRLTNKTWARLKRLKPREHDWELFLREILDKIDYFRSL